MCLAVYRGQRNPSREGSCSVLSAIGSKTYSLLRNLLAPIYATERF